MECGKTAAIILAGGQGSRLRSVVADRQKVVAEVADRPFLSYLLKQIKETAINEIILACGYLADSVIESLQVFPELQFSIESEPLGTGGALVQAMHKSEAENFLVMNGDSYIDVNLENFRQWFVRQMLPAGMLLTKVPDVSRYGKVSLENNLIKEFSEKGAFAEAGLINAGVYCFKRHIIDESAFAKRFSLEKDLFPKLAKAGKLAGLVGEGYFIDIGTPESWLTAQDYFLKNWK